MSKEQVMDYVMNSPANTNPNVLSGMLDSVAESGGGTVEVSKIKIATFNGGGAPLGTNINYLFNGGGDLDDSKTLYDLIGEKTIVSFAYFGHESNGSLLNETTPIVAQIGVSGSSESEVVQNIDPRLVEVEHRNQCTGGSILAITTQQCSSIDIYAICI